MQRRLSTACLAMLLLFGMGDEVCLGEQPRKAPQVANRPSSRRVSLTTASESIPSRGDTAVVRSDSKRTFNRSDDETAPLVRRAAVAVGLSLMLTITLLAFMARKRRSVGHPSGVEQLEILSTITIAPRCCLTLVKAQDQTILVARDSSGVKNMIVVPNGFASCLDAHDRSPDLTFETAAQPL